MSELDNEELGMELVRLALEVRKRIGVDSVEQQNIVDQLKSEKVDSMMKIYELEGKIVKLENALKCMDNHTFFEEYERRVNNAYPITKQREFFLNGPSLALYDEVIRRCGDNASDELKHDLYDAMDL